MKKYLVFFALASSLLGADEPHKATKTPEKNNSAALAQTDKEVKQTQPATKPVPQAFTDDFNSYVSLLRVIDELERDNGITQLRAKVNALLNKLRTQVPTGYTFDPEKKVFVEVIEVKKTEPKQ
jgi:hypothetical protein